MIPEKVHLSRCSGCHLLYYCSKECQQGDWQDHKAECKFLRSSPVDHIPCADTRLVFRMLMKVKAEPDFKAFNGRTYDSLMDHCDMHQTHPELMAEARRLYAEIQNFLGSKTPSFEMVFRALSKKAINSFAIFDGSEGCDSRGEGIYVGLSVHDHSCRPDAFIMIEGPKLQLRTTKKDCEYSDKLTISYNSGSFFRDTYMRRASLYSFYFFVCECEECQDDVADKKRTSGRPTCCPKGWFSTSDLCCSICGKEVPIERAAMVESSNLCLRNTMVSMENLTRGSFQQQPTMDFVDGWVELFDTHKKILSDENTYLIGIADMIYNVTLHFNEDLSIKYADICLPQMRQRPYGLNRATFLCKRLMLYYIARKPLVERIQVLDEAIEAVKVVYGETHELTLSLLAKKPKLELARSGTR